ncbi:MAG: hypothetical protein JW772_01520 [Candidatus Diapherotrites archaeon]|nr:hypothetical protein [Candidatus Diapherotrites archaeon]
MAKIIAFVIPIVIVAIAFALALFTIEPEPPAGELSYYEIVHDRIDCAPACSAEYIVLSNGIVFRRQKVNVMAEDKYRGGRVMVKHNLIDTVRVAGESAAEAIEFAHANVQESFGARCSNCNSFHYFSLNEENPINYFAEESEAEQVLFGIEEKSANLFNEGVEEDDFFLQFVYKRTGENLIDYHFFYDGSVLLNEYKGYETIVIGTRLFTLEEEKLLELKSMIDNNFFESQSGLVECFEKGLEMGYIEAQKNNKDSFVWTCGTQNSRADEIFNWLLQEHG